ncbi:MAG: hypothetical protein AB8G15_09065 [Saprospiraceae bacterium]
MKKYFIDQTASNSSKTTLSSCSNSGFLHDNLHALLVILNHDFLRLGRY